MAGPFWCELALGACAAAGVAYAGNVILHTLRQTGYDPDAEDWFWYVALPLGSYVALLGAAIGLRWHPGASLFVIATTTLLLLFVGIHNSWDSVTYIALNSQKRKAEEPETPSQ